MAKIKNLTDSDYYSSYDSIEDEVDFVITTDENLDDAFSKTLQDQIDGIVDSPLSEALMEADEKFSFNGGDSSMSVDVLNTDFNNITPKPDILDTAADDFIADERDTLLDDFDTDEAIDLVSDIGR